MVVRAAGLAATGLLLPGIGDLCPAEKRQFVHLDIAPFRQSYRKGSLTDEAQVSQVFAGSGNAFNSEIALKVIFDFGCRSRFAHLSQMLKNRCEDGLGAL